MANYINHVTSVQMRIVGNGILTPTLYGYDNVVSEQLATIQMNASADYEPVVLSNFTSYKTRLKGETTQIGAKFKVNHIIIYVKPVFTQRPG